MRWTLSMVCQLPRLCSTEMTSFLYSVASSAVREVVGLSATVVASTQSAAPAPGMPVPMRTRPVARTIAAGSPDGSRPTCCSVATTPKAL
jgi:hypothetical protein